MATFIKMFTGTYWWQQVESLSQLAVLMCIVERITYNPSMPHGLVFIGSQDIDKIAIKTNLQPRTVQNILYQLAKTDLLTKCDDYKGMYIVNPDIFRVG